MPELAIPPITSTSDDQAALALLRGLVAIPSVSGDEGAAVRFLVDALAALGFDAEVDGAGNAVGVIGDGPEVVLLGHIDTVPGDISVAEQDGRLYGRGAVDAKGPLAALAMAAARAHRGGARGRFVVIGCVEEEVASSKGAHYVVGRYAPSACIVGEPSGWDRVTLGYKGVVRATVRAAQDWAHSAHAAATAPERVVAAWQALQAQCAALNADATTQFAQLTPALIEVSSGQDGLREWAAATISLRLPLAVGPQAALALLEQCAAGLTVSYAGGVAAWAAPRTDALARTFTQALRAAGAQPRLVHKTGTADLNIVAPAWGCPAVAYGPGDAALDHTPGEHIVLAEYLRGVAVLAEVLRALDGGPLGGAGDDGAQTLQGAVVAGHARHVLIGERGHAADVEIILQVGQLDAAGQRIAGSALDELLVALIGAAGQVLDGDDDGVAKPGGRQLVEAPAGILNDIVEHRHDLCIGVGEALHDAHDMQHIGLPGLIELILMGDGGERDRAANSTHGILLSEPVTTAATAARG